MLWGTAISKLREMTISVTLVVFLGSRFVSFPLVRIRSLLSIVFALTRFVLWSRSIELIILSLFLYIVNHWQRRRTNRLLMTILQKKFIMFFCLRQCMNKLGINLKIFSPVLCCNTRLDETIVESVFSILSASIGSFLQNFNLEKNL